MIPTIEQIVEDLLAGNITQADAVNWLNQHAADAHANLRDHFAAEALSGMLDFSKSSIYKITEDAANAAAKTAYQLADAMMKARQA